MSDFRTPEERAAYLACAAMQLFITGSRRAAVGVMDSIDTHELSDGVVRLLGEIRKVMGPPARSGHHE